MINILQVLVTFLLFALKSTIAIVVNSTHNITTQLLELKRSENQKLLKIAFGSCFGMADFMNDILKTINNYDPHLWMWLGDAAYTDNMAAVCNPILGIYITSSSR
jgi:hypothetical protein